ncbi:glycosyltransferase family 4 protein [Antarcticirhabdus aurantiaca]|uniref:Glycosyltransferase family 4 protein n=1 Tax=Antarcticirhabdus aurantiaca TaxID=2606717 RepID=A0ACD4NHH1_9HYPH|nr:glycosyltransferase family 4 protein [Antarcticirhabdus aurantiaca]WAJ26234.1 glycosyltransferase family 4 protein [Jeongeuplla avenae]
MNPRDIDVLAPNFKRRLSGVTSTVIQLVPEQAKRLRIAVVGPGLPETLPRLRLHQLPALWRRPASGRPFRIWHARRNVEMLAGIVLRDALRMPLRLVFTSAAQRHHTAYTRRLIRRMDAVIATSGRSAAFLEQPATVVMHGIDLARFGPDGPLPQDDLARRLAGRRVVGCSGRIRHQKGTDVFVEAMIDLLPRHADWAAVITGRTTPENAGFEAGLRERIAAAGLTDRIHFAGEVPDVAAWFRRFDLYVAPPRNEGFGLTPLEAMASGTPVIASDAGAFRELIAEGVTGAVVPADDALALARAAEPFMADPARLAAAGEAALAHVRSHFPLSREAAAIEAVYESLWASAAARA